MESTTQLPREEDYNVEEFSEEPFMNKTISAPLPSQG